jgi:DNA-binding MarR family transcriptional regulator
MRRMAVSERDIRLVQTCYPQIYLACHTRHVARRSSSVHLSRGDASLLSHLDEREPIRASALAAHLGVAPSTLSAAISRLTRLGYIVRDHRADDGRVRDLRLSVRGAAALRAGSLLEAPRVKAMLAALDAGERHRALDGLALLAGAARSLARRP